MQVAWGVAVKAQKVRKHRPETWPQDVGLLGQQARAGSAGIFEAAIIQRNGERHVRSRGRHAQLLEKRGEIGIGLLVIDNESGIDMDLSMVRAERHRIGVAADAVSCFENSYIVPLRQKPGRRQTGNSRSDDGDAAALLFFRFCVDHFSSL